jgi:glycosyltransferase involved in cell wall biosynthesis
VPPFVLAIVGPDAGYEGKARARMRARRLEGVVRFLGPVAGREKLEAFRAADVFALTSYSEGLPLAVLEASGMGVPVVITAECNVPEVEEYGAGRVVPARVEAVAESLRVLLTDEPLRRAAGERGRRMVLERFSVDQMASGIEQLYMRLVSEKAAAKPNLSPDPSSPTRSAATSTAPPERAR